MRVISLGTEYRQFLILRAWEAVSTERRLQGVLENVIERAVILSRNGTLRLERNALPAGETVTNIGEQLREHEPESIEAALRGARGRIAGPNGAAKRLGLPASTLEFRIRRLGIDKFRYRASA